MKNKPIASCALFFLVALWFCFVVSCEKQQSNSAEKYKSLFYEAYEEKNYALAEDYCKKAAELGDADCEGWLGWWAFRAGEYENAIEWYEKSISHGDARSMHQLGQVYEHIGDYEKAREWYEKGIAAGDELEDSIEALKKLPPAGDYAALFEYALNDFARGPDFAVALKYALKGELTQKDKNKQLGAFLWEWMPAVDPNSAEEPISAVVLSDLAFEQIQSHDSEFERFRLKDCFETYACFAKAGDEAAAHIERKLQDILQK